MNPSRRWAELLLVAETTSEFAVLAPGTALWVDHQDFRHKFSNSIWHSPLQLFFTTRGKHRGIADQMSAQPHLVTLIQKRD
jgi:hypothetical protein